MIDHIRLQRFKKFQDVEVFLRPLTVLMGENSSGKTTVLQAINLALNILASRDLVVIDEGQAIVRSKGVGISNLPGISLSDFRELYYGKVSRGGPRGGTGGAIIELFDQQENAYRLQLTSLFGSFNIKCISEATDLSRNPNLHQKPPLFISGFVGLRPSEERVFPVAIQSRLQYGQVSGIIRNLLLDTKEKFPDRFAALSKKLADHFDFILDEITFEQEQDLYVYAHYNDACAESSVSLDFNSSGSGFMQVLQILAPIYRYCPDSSEIVLLDEPDAHLHTNLQATLASVLQEIQAEYRIQIIISTHSTAILRAADPSNVVPISATSKKNCPLLHSDDLENQISARLDSYQLGKSVISGKLVFFEDTDTSIFASFDRLAGTRCFTGPNTVPALRGSGKDDKVPFRLSKVFEEFVKREVEVHVVRDGDGLDKGWRQRIGEYASANNVKLHLLELHEIESYLLRPELLYRAIARRNENTAIPTQSEIEKKVCDALRDTIRLNKYSFEDNLEDTIYKTALLLGLSEFRNQQFVKSEAKRLQQEYEQLVGLGDLVRVGMGKEATRIVLEWVNADLKLRLSRADILAAIQPTDVPEELKSILVQLRSKDSKAGRPRVKSAAISSTEEPDDDGADDTELEATDEPTLFDK